MNEYVLNDYFDWLYYAMTNELRIKKKSYRKLLALLHSIEFRYTIEYDSNRACDGKDLRWYYIQDGGESDILEWNEPCTVLEMLIGLSMRIENIMECPDGYDGASHWFWLMIENLDLKDMTDKHFDKKYIIDRINMFLDREYEPDGNGNIIYIENCQDDLRKVEIWNQTCWFLDSII